MKFLFKKAKHFFAVQILLLIGFIGSAQLDRECINNNETAQGIIGDKVNSLDQLAGNILSSVQALIQSEAITNGGNVLTFENLTSVVNVANLLEQYDKEYDDAYANYCNDIIEDLWNASICTSGLSYEEYREEIYDYLEEEKFDLVDNYASTVFAQELDFQSALLKINADEEEWLENVGEDFDDNNPSFDQPINNELFWSVFSEDWNIELSNPESELNELSGYGKIKQIHDWQFGNSIGGPMTMMDEEYYNYDLIDVIQFLLDNWDTIEDILNWLGENVFGDCHSSTNSYIPDDWRQVPSSMTPDRARRIYYNVRQKGVFGDFRATKTKIEGKAKLYRKVGNRYKKDKNNVVGIGYCTLQWNPCDDEPWPVNDLPHVYPGDHEHFRAKFKHRHPYALTIYRSNDFLTYRLYYNFQFTGEVIFALGPNIDCN